MAGAVGFEPTNVGSKSRCLTAWRRPNNYIFFLYNKCLLSKTKLKRNKKNIYTIN